MAKRGPWSSRLYGESRRWHRGLDERESQRSCGNTDDFSKWAYYLYPDSVDMTQLDCNDFRAAIVREGETLTHRGITIRLEFSAEALDYLSIHAEAD